MMCVMTQATTKEHADLPSPDSPCLSKQMETSQSGDEDKNLKMLDRVFVTRWKLKYISLRINEWMNECNYYYIMEYMCQTIYCVYRVLFALAVVAVHNIYRYILKTDKWVMASCAYEHHFRGFLNWSRKHSNLISQTLGLIRAWLTSSFKHLALRSTPAVLVG